MEFPAEAFPPFRERFQEFLSALEMAFRFGVNLVMYALTGNYKDDSVHLQDIMQRLRR